MTTLAHRVSGSAFKTFTKDSAIDIEIERTAHDEIIIIQSRPGGYENLGKLLEIDPKSLTQNGRIDYLAALEKQYSWLYSLIQDATLAVAGAAPSETESMWDGVDEIEREDVATALRLSPNTAQLRIDVARTLSNYLPETCSALSSGEISSAHANLIAKETADAINRGVSPDILPLIESEALAHSEFHTAAQVGRKIRTLFAQYAPEVLEEVVAIARETRNVRIYPEGDGMTNVIALLPAEDAQTLYLAINTMVDLTDNRNKRDSQINVQSKNNGEIAPIIDDRTIDMKRADALAQIASDFLGRSTGEFTPHRRPVSVNVTVDLPTLLGLANNPGELEGHGPIPASIARQLAADGKWRKFVTDPLTGNLLDMGRDSYLPSQYLVDFLTARDRTCRFPGCSQPARLGDIDHARSWEEGGETKPSNLGFLCRRHHRLKTHGGWKLKSFEDGSCEWISPEGKNFFVPARPMGPKSRLT